MANFYVRHLPSDHPRRETNLAFQIQLVDKHGRAVEFVFLSSNQDEAILGDGPVPFEVIAAARRLPEGRGDFVDGFGKQVLPKDLGGATR